tara:strand:+ start:905 stop:1171 length:267 start_codon:yes stop_codon:yes gene_type:complete
MKSKQVKQDVPQDVFNQWIDLLIMYKRNNLDKNVTISMKSLNEAMEWFNTMKENFMKNSSKDDIKQVTDQLVENGIEKNKINKALGSL